MCLARPGAGAVPPAILARLAEPTAKAGAPEALAQQVLALLARLCAGQGVALADLAGVGVSSCGPFVRRAGCIEVANPNICGGLAGPAGGVRSGVLEGPWPSLVVESQRLAVEHEPL